MQETQYRDTVLPPPGDGARLGRAGLDVRLGAVRRPTGHDHRHADIRRLGAAQGAAEEVRLRTRSVVAAAKEVRR